MTADVDEEESDETWLEFFEKNRTIPKYFSRKSEHNAHVFPFCLTLKALEVEYNSQVEAEFQLRITFYDAANHWFFGSTWIGSIYKSDISASGQHVLTIKEPLYFCTSVNDYTNVAVVELVYTSGRYLQTVGWSVIRIFTKLDSLTDTDETARPQDRKIVFYHGCPAALLSIPEPIEECVHLIKLGGFLTFTLQTHESLEKVLNYVPENVIVNGDDIIPGVFEDGEDDNGIIDILRSPVPLKSWPCHLNKLTVTLLPSIEKFEEILCNKLNTDRLIKDGLQPDGCIVSIAERKLKIGVHNGWKFVKSPHIVYVEREYTQPTSGKSKRNSLRPSSGISNSTKDCVGLALRSRLELNEVIQHPLFCIIFQLEYVVNIPLSQPEIPTGRKARNKLGSSFGSIPLAKKIDVVIRSTTWVPFENGSIDNGNISLNLDGGVVSNPFGSIVYAEQYDFPEDLHFESLGSIDFALTQLRSKKQQTSTPSLRMLSTGEQMRSPARGSDVSMLYNQNQLAQLAVPSTKPPVPSIQPQQLQILQQQRQQQQLMISQSLPQQQVHHAQQLSELPRSQYYTPLIVSTMETPRHVGLSRVAHSLLYTVEYPQIVDTQGNPPFIVDPQEIVKYDLARETRDPLHANEIVFQFLAVSKCSNKTVFFTFQFYRFPQTTTERLHLKQIEGAGNVSSDIPCILQKSARDGKPSTHSPPGLMIKYTADPSFMQVGEKLNFLRYLLQQKLYIDVWDGDSLLLVGSTSITLKHLLRQGQSAVQVSQELDVAYVEYAEDNPMLVGDAFQGGLPQPVGIKMSVEAKLFLRVANIGCLPDMNSEKIKQIPKSFYSTVVEPNSSMMLSSRNSTEQLKMSAQTTAKLMSDCDAELATVLLTRKDVPGKTKKMKENDGNVVRQRKMDRMLTVRNMKGGQEIASSFILQKEEKVQRTRDLRTIQFYREKYKSKNIHSILEESITSHHMIHSSLGRVEFFEFALKNPYPTDQPIIIKSDDTELSVIVNAKEWRYYKQLTDTNTAMEDQMFTSATEDGVKLFLRGNETVHVPFKFQSFTSQHTTPEMGPSHPLYTKSHDYALQTFGKDTTLSSKDIKINFYGDDRKPIAIFVVHVELHPHAINQTFRFYQPEQTFLKKAIRLPPWHTLPGSSVVNNSSPPNVVARCSNDSAICETHQVQVGEPQEVFIKVPCGLSPSVNRFFVVVFIDDYCSTPCQIWQFYVHSLQRVDISATEGQTSKLSILLKGAQSARMVKCFTSHPSELKVAPQDHFMLMSNGVQEINLSLNPLEAGKRMMFLNVVDQEFHQLVKSWLIMATCTPPVITKAFEVRLKVGGGLGSNKKISFMNPYPVKKNFYFKTNREDLLNFKEDGILLGGGESHNICLCFLPRQSEGSATVLIFINDRDGKNEETFCVKVHYSE